MKDFRSTNFLFSSADFCSKTFEGSSVLMFDQPTNHLDLESVQALNNGMDAFPFNIIFTSHDHQLTQTVANRIIEITPDGIIDRMMSYDEYMNLYKAE